MNNEIKTKLQEREFSALKDQRRVLLKWATGCGKSKMAIDLINYQVVNPLKTHNVVHVLFVVAERAHINNWQLEFEKWNLRQDRVATDVVCYNSLPKYKDRNYDIIVFDECHHAFSPKRYAVLEDMSQFAPNIYSIILLSATLSSGKQDMIESVFGKFTTSTITLKDAIQSDILPDPKVYVVAMELDDKKPNQEIRVNKADDSSPVVSWDKRGKYIYKNLPCRIKCTERQKYLYYSDSMEYWKQRYERSHNQFHHNFWVNLGSQRKRFLGELKGTAVYSLISRLNFLHKRFVCFCASVAQADSFSMVGTISSKKSAKYNESVIDGFNAGKLSQIYAVGMITEGMNLKDIQVGIITQLDGKERLFIQKFGRVCRADSPVCYIFYYKNTQDEVYLKAALENIDPKYIKYCSVKDISKIV